MVSVRDCYDGGGIVTAGHGGGAYCDGGVHTGKPVELAHPVQGNGPIASVDLARYVGEEMRKVKPNWTAPPRSRT